MGENTSNDNVNATADLMFNEQHSETTVRPFKRGEKMLKRDDAYCHTLPKDKKNMDALVKRL